ncbi:hypothetical protein CLU79DRAFT_398075 [Phycomyces nitens]|nr:hypothetical protein CLU79DRAFT_398075 [Phycomyces nitens]
MPACGICPASKCMARDFLGASSSGSGNSNTPLIGGLVGGLLGAALVVALGTYVGLRFRKTGTLQLPLFGNKKDNDKKSSRQAMSGVIPVTYIPPSYHSSLPPVPVQEPPQEQLQHLHDQLRSSVYSSTAEYAPAKHESWRLSNPFADDLDIERSNRDSSRLSHFLSIQHSDFGDNDSNRGSVASSVQNHQTATAVQAIQVVRAKPQILRVNTVRVNDGLSRDGSVRTVMTREDDNFLGTRVKRSNTPIYQAQMNPPSPKNQDPFTDPPNRPHPHTDSLMSAPGDGEITIFWSGHT